MDCCFRPAIKERRRCSIVARFVDARTRRRHATIKIFVKKKKTVRHAQVSKRKLFKNMNESKNISRTRRNTLHCRPERPAEWTYDLWATTPTNVAAFFPPGRLKRRRYLSVVVPYVVLASSVFVFFFFSFFLDKSPVFFFLSVPFSLRR